MNKMLSNEKDPQKGWAISDEEQEAQRIQRSEKICVLSLIALQRSGDTECNHQAADAALVDFLNSLGYGHITALYENLDKWYA